MISIPASKKPPKHRSQFSPALSNTVAICNESPSMHGKLSIRCFVTLIEKEMPVFPLRQRRTNENCNMPLVLEVLIDFTCEIRNDVTLIYLLTKIGNEFITFY